ncbi:hypothetical protein ACFO3I_13400 [Rheinheimera marina]|uniref:Uncharacterized protein n=1 Tax=Rheinheimera marina TaxID=1774958 RepID=A0ABV9JP75_9GAMM
MMILAFAGELCLITALFFAIYSLKRHPALSKPAVLTLGLVLGFIAVTASMGASRYLGDTAIIGWHDWASYWSKTVAMPLYLCTLLWLWSNGPRPLTVAFAALGTSPVLGAPALLTDLALVLTLLRLIQCCAPKSQLIAALIALGLVPLCALLPEPDLAMGLFHLALALHFVLIGCFIQQQKAA